MHSRKDNERDSDLGIPLLLSPLHSPDVTARGRNGFSAPPSRFVRFERTSTIPSFLFLIVRELERAVCEGIGIHGMWAKVFDGRFDSSERFPSSPPFFPLFSLHPPDQSGQPAKMRVHLVRRLSHLSESSFLAHARFIQRAQSRRPGLCHSSLPPSFPAGLSSAGEQR